MYPNFLKKLYILILAISWAGNIVAQDYPLHLAEGRYGATLKEALRHAERPVKLTSDAKMWSLLLDIDSDGKGNLIDRYSSTKVPYHTNTNGSIEGLDIDHVLPTAWWENSTPAYNDTILLDLHQIFLCSKQVPQLKRDYPPGQVITPTYTNGYWQVGYGEISGEKIMVYTPAAEYRGDFARCIFYMITLYPVKMWRGLGINIFGDNMYPTLNRYSTSLLMKWHAEDPVDDRERQHNVDIFSHQGNRNPFVLYPTLADHIWGTKSQLPWSASSSSNPPDSTYSDLQPNYSLTDTICLRSPYVPTTASWSINGSPTTDTLIPAVRLGTGTHELRFTSPEISGKIKIIIQ